MPLHTPTLPRIEKITNHHQPTSIRDHHTLTVSEHVPPNQEAPSPGHLLPALDHPPVQLVEHKPCPTMRFSKLIAYKTLVPSSETTKSWFWVPWTCLVLSWCWGMSNNHRRSVFHTKKLCFNPWLFSLSKIIFKSVVFLTFGAHLRSNHFLGVPTTI